jgi:hypothetical protein
MIRRWVGETCMVTFQAAVGPASPAQPRRAVVLSNQTYAASGTSPAPKAQRFYCAYTSYTTQANMMGIN